MNDDFKNYIQLLIDNKDKITHLPERDIHNLLDYITNLQQENERFKKQLEYLRTDEYLNQVKWERNFNETMNKELKLRIEKAVKYIDIYLKNVDDIDINIAVVKDILNGRSDE